MTGPVLCVEGLVRRFGARPAVDGLSFEVASGEAFGLIGPDGAGKTTTLRLSAGLLRADAGTVSVLGHRLPEGRRAARALTGYMPQQYSLYGDLSVEENLRFFAGMHGVGRAERDIRERRLLDIARLERFRDRPARALSGGMYKKLALACALIHKPRLLLLDEPTNGVDPVSRRELWAFLYEQIGEGVAVAVSTPYMDEAERCGRVGLLVDGRLAASGTPAVLKESFDRTVFELDTDPPAGRLPALQAEPGIDAIYLSGRTVRVVSPHGPDFAPLLAALFERHGHTVSRIAAVPPGFEDVYLHLTARTAAGGPAS